MPSTEPPSKSRRRKRLTDIDKLCNALEQRAEQKATKSALIEELGWTSVKLESVIKRADESPRPITVVRGGKAVRFRGSERRGGRSENGFYNDVVSVISKYWGPRRHMREIEIWVTARPLKRSGEQWACPDLVMVAHPGRKSTPDAAKYVHAFEVENEAGFGIQSVCQAFVQGRGAHFTWVMFQMAGLDPADETRPRHNDWDRILWAAKELNVGLVGFTNCNSVETWHDFLVPKRRSPSPLESAAYVEAFAHRLEAKA